MSHFLQRNRIQFPVDFLGDPRVRTVAKLIGPDRAAFVVVSLFCDLAYQASIGSPLGVLSPKARGTLLDSMLDAWKIADPAVDPGQLAASAERALREAEIVSDGAGGGWQCPWFAGLNPHMDPAWMPAHEKGGAATKEALRKKRERAAAGQQAELLPSDTMARPDGTPMPPEEKERVTMLIRLADNALGRKERLSSGYGRPLVLDAIHLVDTETEQMLEETLAWVSEHRQLDTVPANAEQLLNPHHWQRIREAMKASLMPA